MRVLIGCECSGVVRRAFRARGHDAWSCDLKPAEDGSKFHYECDVLERLNDGWDLGIFHPDCTYLCNSGVRWLWERRGPHLIRLGERWKKMHDAAMFFRQFLDDSKVPKVCVENPVMHGHAKKIVTLRQTQTVQPWWFGDPERKATCLWLINLPPLTKTKVVLPLGNSVHREPPGPNRKRNRSVTFQGLADAMAEQWGTP